MEFFVLRMQRELSCLFIVSLLAVLPRLAAAADLDLLFDPCQTLLKR